MGNMRTRWSLVFGAIVTVIALGAVACGDDEGVLNLRATLTGPNGNGISGVALFTTEPNPVTTGSAGRLRQGCGRDAAVLSGFCTVEIEISGLSQGSHSTNLYKGSCENRGEVAQPLGELVAGADGAATLSLQFPHYGKFDLFDTGHYIGVHEAGDDTELLVCGDLAMRPDPALASGE